MKPDSTKSFDLTWSRGRFLSRRIGSLAVLAGLVAIAVLLDSCSRKSSNTAEGLSGGGALVPVLVARAEARDVPMEIKTIGNVQAYSMVSVRSQITGPITKVHFQEGQEVKAGDLLFTID